jgi:hypothetical protein
VRGRVEGREESEDHERAVSREGAEHPREGRSKERECGMWHRGGRGGGEGQVRE